MNACARVAAFVALLVVIFAGAVAAGAALDPAGRDDDGGSRRGHDTVVGAHADEADGSMHGEHAAGEDARTAIDRAFADFHTRGTRHTLGIDLFVAGRFAPLELPPATSAAHVDGYDVVVQQRDPFVLDFSVRRSGRAIVDLQPYLGSQGHLMMLRAGDLAYRHVHPLAEPGLAFHTGSREPGTYRMFLQFRHRGRVRTAAFTRVVRR